MKAALACSMIAAILTVAAHPARADATVTAQVRVEGSRPHDKNKADNVVIWLTPVDAPAGKSDPATDAAPPRLVQKNKMFHPSVLVVPVGSRVEFPNLDPVFHNVFSLFEGKRFDLGLYEAGTTRYVRFDKPGISYIFCNIHPQMSAVVIALETPYYGISNAAGNISIAHVPAGRYRMHVWYESEMPATLNAPVRDVDIAGDNTNLGSITVSAMHKPPSHKNKYGQDYEPPDPQSPAYPQP